jgi:hypothetical protein
MYEPKYYKVVIKQVVEGVLNTAEYDFKNHEDAFVFVNNITADSKIIYNDQDQVVYDSKN